MKASSWFVTAATAAALLLPATGHAYVLWAGDSAANAQAFGKMVHEPVKDFGALWDGAKGDMPKTGDAAVTIWGTFVPDGAGKKPTSIPNTKGTFAGYAPTELAGFINAWNAKNGKLPSFELITTGTLDGGNDKPTLPAYVREVYRVLLNMNKTWNNSKLPTIKVLPLIEGADNRRGQIFVDMNNDANGLCVMIWQPNAKTPTPASAARAPCPPSPEGAKVLSNSRVGLSYLRKLQTPVTP